MQSLLSHKTASYLFLCMLLTSGVFLTDFAQGTGRPGNRLPKPPRPPRGRNGGIVPPPKPIAPPAPIISGQVLNFDSTPLSGVDVSVEANGKLLSVKVSTGDQGKYQINFNSISAPLRPKDNSSNNQPEVKYKITVKKEGYVFRPDTKTTIDPKGVLDFKGLPLCTAKNERPAKSKIINKMGSNELGSIDLRTAGCQGGQYYNQYTLFASQEDAFSIKIEPSEGLYFLMKTKEGKVVRQNIDKKGEVYFNSETPLTEAGEFDIWVSYPCDNPVKVERLPYEYSIKTTYIGITLEGYRRRLCAIFKVDDTKKLDQAVDELLNLPANLVIDEIITKIEAIINDAPTPDEKKKSYEILGTLYGHIYATRGMIMPDLTKAERAIRTAIELGGKVKLKITHSAYSYATDVLLHPPIHRGGKTYWEEPETSWLRIGKQLVMVAGINSPTPYFTCGNECEVQPVKMPVKGTEKKQPLYYLLLIDKKKFEKKELAFIPGTIFSPEKEKLIDLLQRLILDYAK